MSDQMTLKDSPSAISSPESADGVTLCDSLTGMMTDPSGQAPVRANLSAMREQDLDLQTGVTCGRLSAISSASASLQSSLENRLRQKLSTSGSTLYTLTWKEWVTPSGACRFRLRASAPRTLGKERTGWQTPRARGDAGGSRWKTGEVKNLEDQARVFCLSRGLTIQEVAQLSLSATFVRRLMGFPEEWDACAVTATPLTPKPQKSSSKVVTTSLTDSTFAEDLC